MASEDRDHTASGGARSDDKGSGPLGKRELPSPAKAAVAAERRGGRYSGRSPPEGAVGGDGVRDPPYQPLTNNSDTQSLISLNSRNSLSRSVRT